MTRSPAAALSLFLDRLLLRSDLGDDERRAMLALPGDVVRVDTGRDFVAIGDRVTHACLIVDGLAARFAQIRNGNRSIVALHIPGDMADLHSVVAPNVTWALHAVTPTTLLKIPHSALRKLTATYPAVAFAFWRDCVVDANILAQWTVNTARKDAAGRVAHLLCEMRVRYGAVGLETGSTFPFPIAQTDLADVVGLTPVHLNRVLMRLKDAGVAVKSSGDVEMLDLARLAAIGEFDPDYLQLLDDEKSDKRGSSDATK